MQEFYRLSKTKPLTKEEILVLYSIKPICECNNFYVNGTRRFHRIEHITILEWQAIRDRYHGDKVYVTGPYCQCTSCVKLEVTDKYVVWTSVF